MLLYHLPSDRFLLGSAHYVTQCVTSSLEINFDKWAGEGPNATVTGTLDRDVEELKGAIPPGSPFISRDTRESVLQLLCQSISFEQSRPAPPSTQIRRVLELQALDKPSSK